MKTIGLNIENTFGFINREDINAFETNVKNGLQMLHQGTGLGNDFLGWLHLPSSIKKSELDDFKRLTADFEDCEVIVVIGIGGSYLGTKAVVEALSSSFEWSPNESNAENPLIMYAGHNICEDYLHDLCEVLDNMPFGIINISKSGTTTEPAIAFRVLKKLLEKNVGKKEARKLIVAITDKERGALRTLADKEGYRSYVIPDNVGGRFSALTPVGLLPMTLGSVDVHELVRGAVDMEKATDESVPFADNIVAQYAATRNALYAKGKKIEILANFHSKMHYFGEWWKQLYGESEGKNGKGIFPASVDFTTDLHSMGQWIQDGERNIFETVISIEKPNKRVIIPTDKADIDGLNYLAGKRIHEVNKMAELGTQMAHVEGGVPNIRITLPELNAYYIGQLLYFFEKACGISGYLLGVNPFDQPGVEAYKNNMFALLNKPGYKKD